ncbi:Pectinesterase inhibitor domain protein [Raphanus sativus]|nr:Pectinesterase inhibitor domain protein [Raphanus sativus]
MALSIKELFSKYNFRRNKKLVLLSAAVALLLVTAVVGIAVGASKTNEKGKRTLSPSSHAVLTSACSSTRYPELCISAVSTSGGVKLTSQKDVIEASLNLTTTAVEHNYFTVKKLIKNRKGLTTREKTALHDCLETIDVTLDELHEAVEDLHLYPNKKSLREHAGDLKTLLSSAITNQETCLDGFSHDRADKKVRKALLKGLIHVEHMCSNALAMIKNMTDTDIANFELKAKVTSNNRKLKEEETTVAADIASVGELDAEGWPTWLSAGDRRLLQGSTVEADATVAADGSGTFTTVAAAVAVAPENSNKRYVIHIKAGVYRENVDVAKKKKNIMFMGDGRTKTIITASRNVVDGSSTFDSATVGHVMWIGFMAPSTLEESLYFDNLFSLPPLFFYSCFSALDFSIRSCPLFYICHIIHRVGETSDQKSLSGSPLIHHCLESLIGEEAEQFQKKDEHDGRDESEAPSPPDISDDQVAETGGFENNGLLWVPPDPENEEDERESPLYDEEDKRGDASGEWGYLRPSASFGSGEYFVARIEQVKSIRRL